MQKFLSSRLNKTVSLLIVKIKFNEWKLRLASHNFLAWKGKARVTRPFFNQWERQRRPPLIRPAKGRGVFLIFIPARNSKKNQSRRASSLLFRALKWRRSQVLIHYSTDIKRKPQQNRTQQNPLLVRELEFLRNALEVWGQYFTYTAFKTTKQIQPTPHRKAMGWKGRTKQGTRALERTQNATIWRSASRWSSQQDSNWWSASLPFCQIRPSCI